MNLEVAHKLSEQTSWDRHKRRWEGVFEISRCWSWPSPPSQRHGPATRLPGGRRPIGAVRADDQGPPRSRRRFRTRRSAAGGGLGHISIGWLEARGGISGQYRIVSQPPIVVPVRTWRHLRPLDQAEGNIHAKVRAYRATLREDQRQLLERFELVDVARKVVDVGSVGTRAYIVLLQGRDHHDPLFLQVKEATASALEGPLAKSRYPQHGQRVVMGSGC